MDWEARFGRPEAKRQEMWMLAVHGKIHRQLLQTSTEGSRRCWGWVMVATSAGEGPSHRQRALPNCFTVEAVHVP
eukprot:8008960-Karenia_brevis.AAC.1